jgi:hypothetical protein
MISDLVLVKKLPDFIRNAIEADANCFVAIIPKKQYLSAITEAGYRDVKVIDETRYPIQLIDFENPTGQAIIEELKLSNGQTKEIVNNFIDVVSITISAYKPSS